MLYVSNNVSQVPDSVRQSYDHVLRGRKNMLSDVPDSEPRSYDNGMVQPVKKKKKPDNGLGLGLGLNIITRSQKCSPEYNNNWRQQLIIPSIKWTCIC